MSALKNRPKFRPRPRAQASQEPGSDEARDEIESSLSAHSKSPAVSAIASPSKNKMSGDFQRTSSNTTFSAHGDDLDDDDDDDFFCNTAKLTNLQNPGPINFDDDDEEEDELMDESQNTPQDKKRSKDHKRAYRAEWAKKDSKKKSFGLDSDIDDTDEDDEAMRDSTLGGRSSRKHSQQPKKKARQRSRSRELTPPPEVPREKLEMLRATVTTFMKQNGGSVEDINDDASLESLYNNDNFNQSINPELLRMYREGGSQLRQQMREVRPIPSKSQNPPSQPIQTRAAPAKIQSAIVLSDSDDSIPTGSIKASLRSHTRNDRDSSPIEVLDVRLATSTAGTNNDSKDFKTIKAQDPPVPTPPPVKEIAPVVEEEKRIPVILKAEGGIQESVNVKPTTVVGTLLNHFINTHRAKIPSDRISKVRIRFDGEILSDKQTMQDLEVDEDDQLDVVW
ncbi:hypothetical protein L7F22_039026 [Adiantum nelumboides]|nr:hypothetical protein [Adiantum nelumboides]